MSIALVIAVLAVLVIVHESGHFLAARLQGIHVNRFSIGFGPALWKYQGSQTEYALRLFPLGGFVGFPDNDEESTIPDDDPNLLKNRPIPDRAIVMIAGVAANLIFAYLVLVLMTLSVGVGNVEQPGVRISVSNPDSPAAIAGLRNGDVVLAADGINFGRSLKTLDQFQALIASKTDQSVGLKVERGQQILDLSVKPVGENGKGKIGVRLDFTGKPFRRPVANLLEALVIAAEDFENLIVMTFKGLGQLVTNFGGTASQVAGPVAIVAMGSQLVKSDFSSIFDFTAIISINLAVMNILPLPALDGGQLAFLLVEAIRGGKPLPEKFQETVMQGGLVLLLGLGVVMIFKDSLGLIRQGLSM
jgi:membrane-associated protease RseP (regulator of RpoE activity)